MLKKIALLSLCAMFSNMAIAEDTPLLIDGSKSLYRRVLTTLDCELKDDAAANGGTKIPAFSRYYIYEENSNAVRVGPDTTGKNNKKWLDKSCVVDWKVQTALLFSNPADRNRAPIFAKKEDLMSIIDADDPKAVAKPYYLQIKDGKGSDKLIAAEPAKYVDYKNQFYLLPILNFEEGMFSDGNYVQALEIASVNLNQNADKPKVESSAPNDNDKSAIKGFKAAIVFVIDSSISMQPYLDRTRDGIKQIYETLKTEHLEGSVSFGVVAFRSNVKKTPGLEYNTKMFLEPGTVKNSADLDKKLKDLNQAKVSSALFDEDAYSGVHKALSDINWKDFGGRFIVLVTDAGAIEGSNKLSTTNLDSTELRLEAKQKGVAIYALHLSTESGERNKNIDKAKKQYEDLTFNHILQKPLYYQVKGGSVEDFGKMTDQLAKSVAAQVKESLLGNLSAGSALAEEDSSSQTKDAKDQISDDAKQLGYAMQLAYLGSTSGTKAPSFYSGWIADKDLILHNKPVAEPVVLLTKLQLSDLRDVTAKILDAANQGILSSDNMFNQLKSVAASLGRDPNSLSSAKTTKLAELGLLGEYLEGLPYKSRIQDLDEETWSSMGPDEQNRLIEELENKLNYYQVCNDDVDRWVNLTNGGEASEAVYPIPLEALP